MNLKGEIQIYFFQNLVTKCKHGPSLTLAYFTEKEVKLLWEEKRGPMNCQIPDNQVLIVLIKPKIMSKLCFLLRILLDVWNILKKLSRIIIDTEELGVQRVALTEKGKHSD